MRWPWRAIALGAVGVFAACRNYSDVPEPAHGCDEFSLGTFPDATIGGGSVTQGYLRVLALPLATAASSSAARIRDACGVIAEANGSARPEDELPALCAHARDALDSARALGLSVGAPRPRCLLSIAEHQDCLRQIAYESDACSERVPHRPPDVFTCVEGTLDGHCDGPCVDPASQMTVACGPICPSVFQPESCSGVAIRGGCDDHEDGRVVCDTQVAALADCQGAHVALGGDEGVSARLRDAIATSLPVLVEERERLRLIERYLESFTGGLTAQNDYLPRCAPNVRSGAQAVGDSLEASRSAVEDALAGVP